MRSNTNKNKVGRPAAAALISIFDPVNFYTRGNKVKLADDLDRGKE